MSEVRYDLCSVGRRLAPSLLNELVYLAWDSIIALLLSFSLFLSPILPSKSEHEKLGRRQRRSRRVLRKIQAFQCSERSKL